MKRLGKRYEVSVTRKDIKQGKRARNVKCPVAIALRRIFPGQRTSVGWEERKGKLYGLIEIGAGKTALSGYIPHRAAQFVLDFDMYQTVKPFKFRVHLM